MGDAARDALVLNHIARSVPSLLAREYFRGNFLLQAYCDLETILVGGWSRGSGAGE